MKIRALKTMLLAVTIMIMAAAGTYLIYLNQGEKTDMSTQESSRKADTYPFLAEINNLADSMKERILSSETDITPEGTVYYVSNNGKDSNDGKSLKDAWSTLNKVTEAELAAGDTVLFERGGIFRGTLKAKEGVTYSAYGSGSKPCLYGSDENAADSKKWKLTDIPNVYVYDRVFDTDPGIIVFNDGEAHGVKKILTDDPAIMQHSHNAGTAISKIQDLSNDFEFTHNSGVGGDKKLYLYYEKGNPAKMYKSIEIGCRGNVISVAGDNVHIDNLCIKYTGSHGIGSGSRNGLTVTNCELGWIGGSILAVRDSGVVARYGNAIEIYGSCNGYYVDSCYIYQIYDAGITHQFSSGTSGDVIMKNIRYKNNLIEYCTWSIEYYLGAPADGTSPERMMSDIVIEGNICRFAGFGWGNQRADTRTYAHIKSWDHMNTSENFVIRNNVFDRSSAMLIHISASDQKSLPVTEKNTYIQIMGGNFGKYGSKLSENVIYDSRITSHIKNNVREQDAEVRFIFKSREDYFAQDIRTICGSPENLTSWIYRLNDSGVYVREAVFDTGKNDGEEVTIVQITDMHFNYVNERDMEEANPSIMSTIEHRTWLRGGASYLSAIRAMEYASYADQTIITGDTLDYLSWGAMELTQKYVWDIDPNALISLGGHDITRKMQGTVIDPASLESRQAILQDFWRHDIFYTSKVLKDRVMVIQLDNGCGKYWASQANMLLDDIKTAREKGYVILLFEHEPICTRNPADKENIAVRKNDKETFNFYETGIGAYGSALDDSFRVYQLITSNADVIRGIFCGHRHSDFYSEVMATYINEDGRIENSTIPQYVLTGNPYDGHAGHVLKITVK